MRLIKCIDTLFLQSALAFIAEYGTKGRQYGIPVLLGHHRQIGVVAAGPNSGRTGR